MIRFAVALVLALAPAFAQTPPSFLLPDDVQPLKYQLELTIDPAQPLYHGSVQIEADLKNRTRIIWINGKDLLITSVSIAINTTRHPATATPIGGEFIALKTRQPVGPGHVRLLLHFRAPLSSNAKSGAYRRLVNGRWYAFSMFTPIDARRAFPCFDEPRFKTPWEISIRVKQDLQAFSNAPATSTSEEPLGAKLIRFAPTHPLPSEVVAFAVGPFDVLQAGEAGQQHVPIRVVTPAGQSAWGEDAGVATRAVLPRLEAYTGIPYPWAKLDHVALPEGAFGAVENPGMITYLADSLLVAPASVDRSAKDRAIRALESHEIGHQWFGDLVTQRSWKDVWLSEGFATWIAAKMMDLEEPPARHNLHAIASREEMMRHDTLQGFAVRSTIASRKDTDNVYNGTVYNKGAAILLMLENWLGPEPFQRALQSYLHEHENSTATSEDLAAALQSSTHINVNPVLFSFIDRKGIPHIRADTDCQPHGMRVTLKEIGSDPAWPVPVCWRGDGIAATCTVVSAGTPSTINLKTCPAWLYFNASGTGYYRTDWGNDQLAHFNGNSVAQMTAAERLSFVFDLRAGRRAAPHAESDRLLQQLALDPEPEIKHAAQATLGVPQPLPPH